MRYSYAQDRDARDTDAMEIKAFFGLLYLAGLCRTSHRNVMDLCDTDGTGLELFRLVMRRARFSFLLPAYV